MSLFTKPLHHGYQSPSESVSSERVAVFTGLVLLPDSVGDPSRVLPTTRDSSDSTPARHTLLSPPVLSILVRGFTFNSVV